MKTPALLLSLLLPLAALADPRAEELLQRYDALMGPENFEATVSMVAHRDDGTTRTYRMRMLKGGADRARVWFQEPASARGQELLRNGDNAWLYMPQLKRSVRMASRDSFQGGDFNNADVLRTQYAQDYSAQVVEDTSVPGALQVELKARTEEASYDHIKLWLLPDGTPVKGEYYSASGKLLRTAEFLDVKDFQGVKRPARVVMHNKVATKRFSELTFVTLDTRVRPSSARFVLDDLGR